MNMSAKANTAAAKPSPYDAIAAHFQNDMIEVNSLIINHMDSSVPLVKQVATYLIAAGGKRIRPLLTIAFSDLAGTVNDNAYKLGAAVEFIHTATLLHDDVVDESAQRRGKASANQNFGNKTPILVGDFLFSRSFQLMVGTNNIEALRILSDAAAIIAEGEVLQLSVHGKLDIERDTHLKVLEGKTAALFAAACESGALVGDAGNETQQAARNFGLHMGLCFQIIDDLIDYNETKESSGKNQGDDFFEGKITLPVFIAYENGSDEEKTFWENVFRKETRDAEDFDKAYTLIQKHDALNKTYEIAKEYHASAQKQLSSFANSATNKMLQALLDFTLNRHF